MSPFARLGAGLLLACILLPGSAAMSAPERPLAHELIIGCYQPPPGESLQALQAAGFNLVHAAATRQALDEVRAAGLRAWASLGTNLNLSEQAQERRAKLQETIEAVRDHPALLLWDGPDEPQYQVWGPGFFDLNLPAGSEQRLQAAAACAEKGRVLARGLVEGHAYARSLDAGHPIWINHAPRHPLATLRELAEAADIHSVDFYPVPEGCGHSDLPNENLSAAGQYVDRLAEAMGGRPTWMVLQGFSWEEIGIRDVRRTVTYPSFAESRFLAYDCLLHGATGLLYWGTHTLRPEASHWQALKALAAELSALSPVLTAPPAALPVQVRTLSAWHSAALGARASLRQVGDQWYLLLVNEERYPLEVAVSGLAPLAGRSLELLYSDQRQVVAADGSFAVSLPGYVVNVYATSRRLEAPRPGRDFAGRLTP